MEGISLALGGGGITGCGHVGVIRALEEEGIPVASIAGTSAGAMVAAFYAGGCTGRRIQQMVPEITGKLLDYDFGGLLSRCLPFVRKQPAGLFRGRRLTRYLTDAIGGGCISKLSLPFAVTATDLCSARQVLFANRPVDEEALAPDTDVLDKADTATAVLASMSIPGIFRPVQMGDRLLVDGGLMDNCPAAALKAMGATRVLAVNLVSVAPLHPRRWTFSAILSRSLNLGLHRMSQAESGCAGLVLSPDMAGIGLLDFSCMEHCMEKGYESARQHMPEIRRLLEQPAKPPGEQVLV